MHFVTVYGFHHAISYQQYKWPQIKKLKQSNSSNLAEEVLLCDLVMRSLIVLMYSAFSLCITLIGSGIQDDTTIQLQVNSDFIIVFSLVVN